MRNAECGMRNRRAQRRALSSRDSAFRAPRSAFGVARTGPQGSRLSAALDGATVLNLQSVVEELPLAHHAVLAAGRETARLGVVAPGVAPLPVGDVARILVLAEEL